MGKLKIACHICKFKMEQEESPSVCTRCGANLKTPENEQLLKMDVGYYVKKGAFSQGLCTLFLTNTRLFLVCARKGILGFGADSGMVGAMAMRDGGGESQLEFNIPLENIAEVREGKVKFSKSLIIKTKSGEEYIPNMQDLLNKKAQEEWVTAIHQACGR